jgi:hypothetical protein
VAGIFQIGEECLRGGFTEIPALGRDLPAGGVGLSELNPREDLNMATAIDFKLKDLRQIYVCGVVHTI